MKIEFKLREKVLGYFGLPIFTKLSEKKLKHEIEFCQDPRLEEAVTNISLSLKNESNVVLKVQADFFHKFIIKVLTSDNLEFIKSSLELVILLLLQPSCRRFIKPLLEDVLFPSLIKLKISNSNLMKEFENVFFFPMDERFGVHYETYEEYISSHFSKVRYFQSKVLESNLELPIKDLPLSSFGNYFQISSSLMQLSNENLTTVLAIFGNSGFKKETPRECLIDSIASTLVLRESNFKESFTVFPTEVSF